MSNNVLEMEPSNQREIPLALKVIGFGMIAFGVFAIPAIGLITWALSQYIHQAGASLNQMTTAFMAIEILIAVASAVGWIALGARLLRNKRRHARHAIEIIIVLELSGMLCNMMISGLDAMNFNFMIRIIALIALMTYLDPALSEERALQRKLRKMETRERAEEGTLGRDESGKGYIQLDFFNLFWVFTVCCVLGVIVETIYHFVTVGGYQNRTGMLWGPFSPIYGFGAALMTIALNRFYDRNVGIIFLVSAVIGGAFEFAVSWFLQYAFGIVAWDYTGTFMSIGGRTNFMYMCMWGVLGCFWIKVCLPRMLQLVNKIPWNWRYGITAICAAFMITNGAMTLLSLDCWYQREAGVQPANAIERFCAEHYDNEFMAHHFQTMTINPEDSTRAK